jgi:hypothetical protein
MKTINVGMHRGKGRIWLEGNWLGDAGFPRGARYVCVVSAGDILIDAREDGDRKVSGKGDRPIIDMNSAELTPHIGPKIVVMVRPGCMIIRSAN